MKRLILMALIGLGLFGRLFAGEGMWIPMLLKQLNEKEMQAMGMRITADDIYSLNHSSLKDAIVLFGRGCTGEIVSDQGLLLTNHHCGFGQIQKHSSVEHDYLTNGFWAMNRAEELPNPGLTVTMLVKMEDVTQAVLGGLDPGLTEAQRAAKIAENIKILVDLAKKETDLDVSVRAFYHGNQYFMIFNQIFKDIRLVGAPPSNIGKFGGDTDNWMWPRHTGDFSVFRIYVGKDGKPAEYHPDNVPYKPAYHLPVSLKGVTEGDFTFVFGYPARTNEYLPSDAIRLIAEASNPQKIKLRETRLAIFKKYSANDSRVRIQYADKDAGVANGWKKMIGESKGIRRLDGVGRKQDFEARFEKWAESNAETREKYAGLLNAFKTNYKEIEKYTLAADYITECGLGIELIRFASQFRPMVDEANKAAQDTKKIKEFAEKLQSATAAFFKDYYQPIDYEVANALMLIYLDQQPENFRPDFVNEVQQKFKGDVKKWSDYLFGKSVFLSPEKIKSLLEEANPKKIKSLTKDPAYQYYVSLANFYETQVRKPMQALTASNDSLQRLYMQAQMEMNPEKRFYPDANFTLRVAYGKVEGFSPADAVYYEYYTSLKGIMEKENPLVYDYVVEPKLKELYQQHDFGEYADASGELRVAFAASNHTTGGNSGSPVLNADGQMVGLNFDRCWEGTMSDLMYDPQMSRNITVDIRYVLFIMDKFAGARHLVDEMTIVR
ncbi:MAG: S46 family peptidase [Bacteroidales bacterium]|nr:S46 family peptidase [Bacteroidales bacterium]